MVAVLTAKVGTAHIELVEDAVQAALASALAVWTGSAVPEDPGAWLYRAAHNHLMSDLRQRTDRHQILERAADGSAAPSAEAQDAHFEHEVEDDLLRMLFVCCDPAIPPDSQLVLALKTLCGFSTGEIALRLFASEASVQKRLSRARDRLRECPPELDTPPPDALRSRLPRVHAVLYVLFNEGYLSAHADQAIRGELCAEAIRLTTMLAGHAVGAVPETFALLALMHLHAARLPARVAGDGGLVLLEEQDRSLWDRSRLQTGALWLARSATGGEFSRYHAEAGIAAEHAFAPSFGDTRWREIAELYAMLERIAPSPLHTLNRAVAVAEWQGPEAGLTLLEGLAPPAWLAGSYLWDAVACDLHRRAGHHDIAREHHERAIASAPTEAVRTMLRRRFATTSPPDGPPHAR